MDIFHFFILFALFLIVIVFLPDIMPYCHICRHFKPRFFFKIHKTVNVRLWYGSKKSTCRKCCKKYNIDNLSKSEMVGKIKKNVESRL